MSKQIRALSLVGFKEKREIEEYLDRCPEALFELSYIMEKDFLESLRRTLACRVVSLHACCPRERLFPNFASFDKSVARESLELLQRSAGTALSFGARIVVLHPGYMTNSEMPSDGVRRIALLDSEEFRPYIGLKEGSICRPDYLRAKRYREHFKAMKDNLVEASEKLEKEGAVLAVENLNPRAGYMLMSPSEMKELAGTGRLRLCLDIGHLWISSLVFGFDYLQGVKDILGTGAVVSVHLHTNPSSPGFYEDSHSDVFENGFPMREIVRAILAAGGANMVLETVRGFERNTRYLEDLVRSLQPCSQAGGPQA